MSKSKKIDKTELNSVYDTIEDYIFENHKFCSLAEISKLSGLNENKCRTLLAFLIEKKRVYKVFESKGKPTIYLPTYMLDEILRKQLKPKWVENYSFDEKKDKIKEIKKLKEETKQYEMFERLTYATNTPLEEAVAFALNFLEFKDVKHLNDPEYHDVEFSNDDKLYLVEIKGKGRHGKKEDILQLGGWIKNKLNEGMKRDELEGLFAINHYRKIDPTKRNDSLTPKAKEYLKLYNSTYFETNYLYELVKDVTGGSMSKEDARKKITSGQSLD